MYRYKDNPRWRVCVGCMGIVDDYGIPVQVTMYGQKVWRFVHDDRCLRRAKERVEVEEAQVETSLPNAYERGYICKECGHGPLSFSNVPAARFRLCCMCYQIALDMCRLHMYALNGIPKKPKNKPCPTCGAPIALKEPYCPDCCKAMGFALNY